MPDSCPPDSARYGLSASFRASAVLKDVNRAAGAAAGSPVRELRPLRVARVLAENFPKPDGAARVLAAGTVVAAGRDRGAVGGPVRAARDRGLRRRDRRAGLDCLEGLSGDGVGPAA